MDILSERYKEAYIRNNMQQNDNNEFQRYLFLDIDGVLNTARYSKYLIDHNEDENDEFGAIFDSDAVNNLALIINSVPDLKLIISSSWRFKGWDWMNRLWEERQLPGKIFSFTPGLEYVKFSDIINQNDSESVYPYGTRGLEIGEWLRLYASRNSILYKYAIIDDEDDFPPYYKDHVILTDQFTGITKDTVVKVLELLL